MKKQVVKIVKIGGKLIENEAKLLPFLKDFALMQGPKVLVHGGGKMATEMSGKLGYETKMLDGRRITDANAMQVITMVYGGLINKNIVAKLQALNCNAIGLCGADGKSIVSKKRPVREVDYGYVGDIVKVDEAFISGLLEDELVPVFSAISYSEDGQLFNTNADSVASEIARALSAKFEPELYYCFEKKGVLQDPEDDSSVIENIDGAKYQELLEKKIISEGMLPKLQNCFEALEKGVERIYLGDSGLLNRNTLHTKIIK
ncbi:acetylglutamate kinase [Salegentibacter chungangensis]|uniref:Acetylglutamate kinase n=1 Tax=Salegentibacter chungangensis TaxID=1335724 RepID=A0ABW3NRD2_9FLAO